MSSNNINAHFHLRSGYLSYLDNGFVKYFSSKVYCLISPHSWLAFVIALCPWPDV